ncbi:hypothetical protein PYW07_005161 [Mythimna separata]|uniref:Enoyl-[acyl-carrier-protein] reductase, mitochondrial n=1 Tax=Mythimna separata TaxID=271217 RepID=A0AAD7YDW1_MYTSE|nr:hypothetical protein PYW07_005161 [Mythimna separata]
MLCKKLVKTVPNMTGSTVRCLMSNEIVFSNFGHPQQVIQLRKSEVPPLGNHGVLVRMLAAPVNPSDINTIQGKYPVKVKLPHIPGNEGVGVVEEIGGYVKNICPGNHVIITKPAQGTWRDIGVFNEAALKVVPNYLGLAEAATLGVNCTAYRMLSDYRPVRACNMSVIQNAANSACGQYVIQICKAWGIQTINIVRHRRKIDDLKSRLECLGASFVLTENEVKSTNIFKKDLIHKPSLALNCVGGKSASQMMKHLRPNGCMVTYGGMSKQPVTIPTPVFIFKTLSFCGFWMTAWNATASDLAKDEMLGELISLVVDGRIRAPLHKKRTNPDTRDSRESRLDNRITNTVGVDTTMTNTVEVDITTTNTVGVDTTVLATTILDTIVMGTADVNTTVVNTKQSGLSEREECESGNLSAKMSNKAAP